MSRIGTQHEAARLVQRADWQAGRTPGNHDLRPTLDGKPVPLAFAARAGSRGWVICYVDDPRRREWMGRQNGVYPYLLATGIDGNPKVRRLRGVVRIVAGDESPASLRPRRLRRRKTPKKWPVASGQWPEHKPCDSTRT